MVITDDDRMIALITDDDRIIASQIVCQAERDAVERAERSGNGAAVSINRQRQQVAEDRLSAAMSRQTRGNVRSAIDARYLVKELDAGNDQWAVYDNQTGTYWSHDGWQQPAAGLASVLTHAEAMQMADDLSIQARGNGKQLWHVQ